MNSLNMIRLLQILILDSKIDNTYEVTEHEFDIIIFEREYDESNSNEVIERIKGKYISA